jgi:predicted nucleotidyltransferase
MDNKELIKKIAKKYNIDSVGIFGSRARGDHSEDSDYDIFVIGDLSLDMELNFEGELEKHLNTSVDVIKLNKDTDKILSKNIVNEGFVIYSNNNSFEKFYNDIERFFIDNSDFIRLRERDLLD